MLDLYMAMIIYKLYIILNNRFLFCVISGQNLTNNFPPPPQKKFNEVWLKVGKNEYIYITEITFF